MDPTNRGPEEYGHEGDRRAPRPRPSREPLTPELGQHAPAVARTAQVFAGEYLVTVNPVDGSEIELCPPGGAGLPSGPDAGKARPDRPGRRTATARAEAERAARPPAPAGPAQPTLPLLGRQDEREQLVRLLARGRSVRLVGPAGSGRTRLLDLVAEDCADLAPDGVVRLCGLHRTTDDLLHDLFHAVHDAPDRRPDPAELRSLVGEIGAVVVIDDLDLGGTALDGLLDATPECAYLFGTAPGAPAPSAESGVEEVTLSGLDRPGGIDIIERVVGRALTEEETNWAGDLWFESEGLPLRFVQAGALLRQRDRLRAGADAVDELGVFEDARALSEPADAVPADTASGDGEPILLPSLGEAAAPAPLLASRLSASARATLRFAVALDGEVPHQAHLPALVGDTHADAALGELAACGLVSPVGSRYRLAAGVQTQLEAAGYADDADDLLHTAAQHYAWWAGHPSVAPERVCAEADAVLAALGALAPAAAPPAEGEESVPVRLARAAAPAFAAGLRWDAWENTLRAGAEAARLAGEVAEQAYFHHELGVLALCEGDLDRARAELESSIGLRGALADKRGTVAGRRALALVADRSGDVPGIAAITAAAGTGEAGTPDARPAEPAQRAPRALPPGPSTAPTLVTPPVEATGPMAHRRDRLRGFARRNLVAAGAGALLVAVLGTVVTLGATSDKTADDPADRGGVSPSVGIGTDDDGLAGDGPDTEEAGADGDTGEVTTRPADTGPTTSATPSPTTGTGGATPGDGSTQGGTETGASSPAGPSEPATTSPPPSASTGSESPSASPSKSPTGPPSTATTPPASESPTGDTTTSASGSVSSSPTQSESMSQSAGTPGTSTPGTSTPESSGPASPDTVM
ncbi:ATP-binding protein [Streptomyces sp. bgisy153]|uniref:ATP-binding protein n=1 Tax=Streptomyces sp. bgisy153 TaxID=3413793 RepID=UPI003D749026